MITLSQLETFLWLARLGTTKAVASHLNITQPAISTRISNLQEALQVTLVTRSPEGMQLTREGLVLKDHAEQIEARVALLKSELIPKNLHTRRLRVGAIETIAQTWLPELVREIKRTQPQVQIDLIVDTTDTLRDQLLARSVDLALLMGPVSKSEVTNKLVSPIPMGWFCKEKWDAEQIRNAQIITFSQTTRIYKQQWGQVLRGNENRMIIPTSSLSAGFEMVAQGVGVGVLPRIYPKALLKLREVVAYNGGYTPEPLDFTVSYMSEPVDFLVEQLADLAVKASHDFFDRAELG